MTRRKGARITFEEVEPDRGRRRWSARFGGRDLIDVSREPQKTVANSTPKAEIEQGAPNVFTLWVQGGHSSGRRYSEHYTLGDAQERAKLWARRRFRIAPEVAP